MPLSISLHNAGGDVADPDCCNDVVEAASARRWCVNCCRTLTPDDDNSRTASRTLRSVGRDDPELIRFIGEDSMQSEPS